MFLKGVIFEKRIRDDDDPHNNDNNIDNDNQ